jgi:hypothetical protein
VVVLNGKEADLNSLLIMQDLIDILYKVNRIKDNSYDPNFTRQFDNMQPIDKVQNIIKYISKNTDRRTRKNADILINILGNINEVNRSESSNRKKNSDRNKNKNNQKYSTSLNVGRNSIYDSNSLLNKLKYFLKSLNDE